MDMNKISKTNLTLCIINIIFLLFFIFSDQIIMSIKWSDEGLRVADLFTITSAIVMMVTAWFMYQANTISKDSVLEMKRQNEEIYKPYIVADAKLEEHIFYIYLKNIGQRNATKIKYSITSTNNSFNIQGGAGYTIKPRDNHSHKLGIIEYIGAGQELKIAIYQDPLYRDKNKAKSGDFVAVDKVGINRHNGIVVPKEYGYNITLEYNDVKETIKDLILIDSENIYDKDYGFPIL